MFVLVTAYLPTTGMSGGEVGWILGLNGVTMIASAIPIGMIADRRGRKPLFMFGLVLIPPSLMVFALTSDFIFLVVASIVLGLAEGAFTTTWNALIADQTTVHTRNAAFSMSFVYGTMGGAIGFAISVLFPTIESWTGLSSHAVHTDAMFILALVSAVSPISLSYLLKNYKEELRPGAKILRRGKNFGTLIKFSGINSLIGLGAGFIIPLIATWFLYKFEVKDVLSGPLLGLSSVLMAFAAIASTGLAHRYGMTRAIVLVQGWSTVFMISLAFLPNAALAAGFYLVRAALMNMAVPILDSFLMGIVTKEERGLASAVNSILWRLPNSVSTVFGGMMLQAGLKDPIMLDLPIFIATGFYVTAISLFYVTFKDMKPST
jgi:predicted MFS family arabinose efflux permease